MHKPYVSEENFLALVQKSDLWCKEVELAFAQAKATHSQQVRDDGESYLFQHIYPVTISAAQFFSESPERQYIVVAMLLHDVLEEDVTYTEAMLRKNYSDNAANIVIALTKDRKDKKVRTQQDKHEEHVDFLKRLRKSSRTIQILKLLDRLNNLQCTVASSKVEKYERYLRDTEELYLPLATELSSPLASAIQREIDRISRDLRTVKTSMFVSSVE